MYKYLKKLNSREFSFNQIDFWAELKKKDLGQ